jgi:hypothetical protein
MVGSVKLFFEVRAGPFGVDAVTLGVGGERNSAAQCLFLVASLA